MEQVIQHHLREVDPDPEVAGDDALMLRVAAGEHDAFRTLVDRHQTAVRRFCRTIAGDQTHAHDAAQETFLRLWSARERYVARGKFTAYLFTLARNVSRSMTRRRRVLQWFGHDSEAQTGIDAETAMIAGESTRLVTVALDRLPERFRTPLILRFIEGLGYDEIAEVIGRTPSTARSRVHYGLAALRERLPDEVMK